MKKLHLSVALNILLIFFFIGKRIYYSYSFSQADTISDYDIYNNARKDVFKHLEIDSSDIVFLGNSITEAFPVNEMFGSIKIKNRGIGSNETRHIIERLPDILKHKPRKVFLEIGINDLSRKVPANTMLANYEKIVQLSKKASVLLYIYSIFPTRGADAYLMPDIIAMNKKLDSLCRNQHTLFINLFPYFLRDNQLDSTLTYDGVHFNGTGYQIWKQHIDSLIY